MSDKNAYLREILQRLGADAESITMSFGSNEFKYKLLSALDNEDEFDELLRILNIIILKHTFNRIPLGFDEGEIYNKNGKKSKPLGTNFISQHDTYDIAGDVYCEVVKRLDRFVRNIMEKGYDEKARQAWLRKIIYCSCAKHLNKIGKLDYIIDTDDEDEITYTPISEYKSPEYIAICNDAIRKTITIACDAPFKPEKILGYLYNVNIFRELEGRKKNSSSRKTCDYMNDKVLFILNNEFVPIFNKLYTAKITYNEIDSLCKVLGYDSASIKGLEVFNATPKHITDWSNRVKTYIYKYKNNVIDEENEGLYAKRN